MTLRDLYTVALLPVVLIEVIGYLSQCSSPLVTSLGNIREVFGLQ